MRRSLWAALMCGGVGLSALAQDTPDTAPVPEQLAPPGAADPGTGAVDPVPDVGAEDPTLPIDPPVADDAALPEQPADPATDAPGVEEPAPAGPLPGNTLPDAGRPGTALPADPEVRDPITPDPNAVRDRDADALPEAEFGARRRQQGRLEVDQFETDPLPRETDPLLEDDLPPRRVPPGADVRETDGQGAPLIEQQLTPEDDPLRDPIERQPLPQPGVGQPLPADPDGAGPIPGGRRGVLVDPAYGAPAPPRVQPEVEIGEVVRNPVRVYEARLLVLMGHKPAATEAIDTLARRFPTDARVPYLRYFLLSRKG